MIFCELIDDDIAKAAGIAVQNPSPVLAICRKLIAAGHDPATPLEAFREGVLCLHVRSIGEAARLRVVDGKFQIAQEPVLAPPIRLTDREARISFSESVTSISVSTA